MGKKRRKTALVVFYQQVFLRQKMRQNVKLNSKIGLFFVNMHKKVVRQKNARKCKNEW